MQDKVERLSTSDAIRAVKGVDLLDVDPGFDTHRTVVTFVGEPEGLFTGGENSAENMSNIARSGHPYPVYGGGEERAIAAASSSDIVASTVMSVPANFRNEMSTPLTIG